MSRSTTKADFWKRRRLKANQRHSTNGADATRKSKMVPKPDKRGRSRFRRWWASLSVHVLILGFSYLLAFQLGFEFSVPDSVRSIVTRSLPWVLALKLIVFFKFGSFQARWRFVTMSDLALLIQAAVVSTLVIAGIDYFLIAQYQIPHVVLILDWGITIIALGGVRSASRIVREHMWSAFAASNKRPVLVIGADAGGEALVREIQTHPVLNYRVVGFLDDNSTYRGSSLSGIPFVGIPDEAVSIARKNKVKDIVVITGSLCGKHLRSLVDACREADIQVKMIPPLDKLLNESYQLQERDVDINDLLRRTPIRLDTNIIGKMLKGRTVMVTGAGGSIGSEICRQVVLHDPEQLILVERAENSLFEIEQQMLKKAGHVSLHACLADVCDEERLHVLFQKYQPEVVFHTAAHKHVPLMEENAGEAVKNNIFGTKMIADLSDQYSVERFILISTDKAVKPTSVMGLSKRLAERCIYSLAQTSTTNFVVVRFGNVLGSNGSVVPLFQEQIRCGGPVTVTHPEMQRFFMTIPEASQLVLQAAAIGKGGEIFVLDMGKPVKIVDLAKDLIRLSGFDRDEIETRIVGVRPGEKLHEEIFDTDETSEPTSHPKLRVVYPQVVDSGEVERCLSELASLVNAPASTIREKLLEIIFANGESPKPRNGFATEIRPTTEVNGQRKDFQGCLE